MPRKPSINREVVRAALEQTHGSANAAAKIVGVHPNTVLQIQRELDGLCRRCAQPVDGPYGHCAVCRATASARQLEKAHARRANGLCAQCNKPICPPSTYHCADHRGARNANAIAIRKRHRATKPEEYRAMQRAWNKKGKYGDAGVAIWNKSGGACQVCGAPYKRRGGHLHHIDEDKANNTIENLICLCRHCHNLLHLIKWHPNLALFLPWFRTTYPDVPI